MRSIEDWGRRFGIVQSGRRDGGQEVRGVSVGDVMGRMNDTFFFWYGVFREEGEEFQGHQWILEHGKTAFGEAIRSR